MRSNHSKHKSYAVRCITIADTGMTTTDTDMTDAYTVMTTADSCMAKRRYKNRFKTI